jgi:hypothetical protein
MQELRVPSHLPSARAADCASAANELIFQHPDRANSNQFKKAKGALPILAARPDAQCLLRAIPGKNFAGPSILPGRRNFEYLRARARILLYGQRKELSRRNSGRNFGAAPRAIGNPENVKRRAEDFRAAERNNSRRARGS